MLLSEARSRPRRGAGQPKVTLSGIRIGRYIKAGVQPNDCHVRDQASAESTVNRLRKQELVDFNRMQCGFYRILSRFSVWCRPLIDDDTVFIHST